MKRFAKRGFLAAVLLATWGAAMADVTVGVVVSATGPAASLGIAEKNTIAIVPQTAAGQKINFIVLDDGSDTTQAVSNTRRLVSDNKVDIIIGSSITPNSLAMIDVAAESKTPMISLVASTKVIEPMDDKRKWVFKVPQNDSLMAGAIADHMVRNGVKTAGYIGYNDAYGESWLQEFGKAAKAKNIKLVATEAFARTDTSVTGQVLKLMAAKPDAILIAGSGTPSALPEKTLRERGYQGKYYQTHGAANTDFLRVGGKDVDGTFLPVGPMMVTAQLPDGNPVKKSGEAFVSAYETKYGKGTASPFGGYAWDANRVLDAALPEALKKAKPGTPEFRAALRDAIEHTKDVAGAHGIFTMSPTDHNGMRDAVVMVKIENGTWKYQP